MSERVVITGIGCVSCFGMGHRALVDAISAGRSGIAPITQFDTADCRSRSAAMIRDFDPSAFFSPLKLRRVDAVGRIALTCARLLFDDAGGAPGEHTGIALGTSTAGLDSLVEYLDGLSEHGPAGVPAILFSNTVANAPASLCAIEFGLRGPNVTFNQREASSLAAIAFSIGAIREGRTTAMVTGGADCVEETFFKVHDRFRVLSPMRTALGGTEAARPFDRDRNGFILGEGGFLLLVESASSAERRGARTYGEIVGVGATASKTVLNGWPGGPHGPCRERDATRVVGRRPARGPDCRGDRHVEWIAGAGPPRSRRDRRRVRQSLASSGVGEGCHWRVRRVGSSGAHRGSSLNRQRDRRADGRLPSAGLRASRVRQRPSAADSGGVVSRQQRRERRDELQPCRPGDGPVIRA